MLNLRNYKFMTLLFVCWSPLCSAQSSAQNAIEHTYNDGPYVVYDEANQRQFNVRHGQGVWQDVPADKQFTRTFEVALSDSYQGVDKLAAISDIHGQVEIFKTLLRQHKVVDDNLDWRFGKGHLVITGDIFDRGDTVTEALWLVYKLEQQALAAGGKVHYLLGNHEYLVLRDDQRYLHPKYVYTASFFDQDLRKLFAANTVLGRWLRSKSTIIKINDFVFLHGGIHQQFLDLDLSLEQANDEFRATIGLSKDALAKNPIWQSLHSRFGPIWYRGYFRDEHLRAEDVGAILTQLNASKIIVGHTSMDEIESHHAEQVIAIDSSIKKGKKGELLLWQDGTFWRGKMNGRVVKL